MEEIEENEYLETLKTLVEKKQATIREDNEFKRNNKIARYLNQRGYELNLIWEVLKSPGWLH